MNYPKKNNGVNQGYSGRLGYDQCFIRDDIEQSVAPLLYKLNPNQINNCNACLSTLGPRSSIMGYGDSTVVGHTTAPSQDLVDVESILSNRNVLASKCKDGKVNDIDVMKFPLKHARICNDNLNPIASHLTNPSAIYREISIDRFYNLPTNPQANIFYNFAVNTQLEAKDNYREKIPKPLRNAVQPKPYKGNNKGNYCN